MDPIVISDQVLAALEQRLRFAQEGNQEALVISTGTLDKLLRAYRLYSVYPKTQD